MKIKRNGYLVTAMCVLVGVFICLMGGAYIALESDIGISSTSVLGVPAEAAALFALGAAFVVAGAALAPRKAATAPGATSLAPALRHRRMETGMRPRTTVASDDAPIQLRR